ncbi:hypothetical protein M0805_008853 [Coniferiporia weirii]|nr:hypothetical protein M0805_008853 [Coniferiporia weirii]
MSWELGVSILIEVLALLDVEDILSLRLTSRYFTSLTRLRTVWHTALVRHVLSKDIPIPRGPRAPENVDGVASSSATELERKTRTALNASRNWLSKKPVRTRTIEECAKSGKLSSLHFLRIRSASGVTDENEEGRFLLSLTGLKPIFLRVWDVENTDQGATSGMRLAAEWKIRGYSDGMVIDEGSRIREPTSRVSLQNTRGALIAVSVFFLRKGEPITYYLHILRFTPPHSSSNSHPGFCEVKSFTTREHLGVHALCGRLIALTDESRRKGEPDTLKVVDWVQSTTIFTGNESDDMVDDDDELGDKVEVSVELVPSASASHKILNVHFMHDWVLVVRISVLEMYSLQPGTLRPYSKADGRHVRALRPARVYKWTEMDSGQVTVAWSAVTERVSWEHECATAQCVACRGEGYVNSKDIVSSEQGMDRDMDEEGMDRDGMQHITCACQYRPLSLVMVFGKHRENWQVRHYVLHVPDDSAPALVHSLPLFTFDEGRSVFALGRFGTFLSMDTFPYSEDDENGTMGREPSYNSVHPGDRATGRLLPLPTRFQSTTPSSCSSSEPLPPPGDPTVSTTVFGRGARGGWHTSALCERTGRVVLGYEMGMLDLWDYF